MKPKYARRRANVTVASVSVNQDQLVLIKFMENIVNVIHFLVNEMSMVGSVVDKVNAVMDSANAP